MKRIFFKEEIDRQKAYEKLPHLINYQGDTIKTLTTTFIVSL